MKQSLGHLELGSGESVELVLSGPTVAYPEGATLTSDDVWGKVGGVADGFRRVSDGMVVARSKDTCPVWGDEVPYKGVTVIGDWNGDADFAVAMVYWLEYVLGSDAVDRTKVLADGRLAMRGNYTAW